MNVFRSVSVALIVVLAIAGAALAEKDKPQTVCPVMGGEIVKDIYVDHDGKRVYLCCPACVDPFKKDPAKYLGKLAEAGVTLEDAPIPQTKCPVMSGKKIDKKLFVDYKGTRVYACCQMCVPKIKKDPAKYIKLVEAWGVTLDKTPVPQTKCPLMGGKIDKSVFADYKGNRVYFCCPMCIGKFKADPAQYVGKLKKEGVTLDKVPAPKPAHGIDVQGSAHDHSAHGGH